MRTYKTAYLVRQASKSFHIKLVIQGGREWERTVSQDIA